MTEDQKRLLEREMYSGIIKDAAWEIDRVGWMHHWVRLLFRLKLRRLEDMQHWASRPAKRVLRLLEYQAPRAPWHLVK